MIKINLHDKEKGRFSMLFVKAFSFSLLFFLASMLNAQVVISEVFSGGSFELRNTGSSAVDISSYWVCDFPDYRPINQLTIECGSLNLAPGEEVVFTAPGLHEPDDSELGLYTRSDFADATAIASYIEWGSSGHQRSGLAIGIGLWDGNAVSAFSDVQSLELNGSGTVGSDWSVNATPMICATVDSGDTGGGDTGGGQPVCNADGGTISTPDRTSICVDGNPDPINVSVSGGSGSIRGWIITDDQRNILTLPAASPFDLDGAGPGNCFIYYIAYEPGLSGLSVGQNVANLQGCFGLSNSIEVIRQVPDGGTVMIQGGLTTFNATAGNVRVPVAFSTTATSLSYWYIITDENDNILNFVNPADTPDPNNVVLDLSAAPPGECHIWGWSYLGEPDPVPGESITTLTDGDCETISTNFITVNRAAADAPPVDTKPIVYTGTLTGSQESCPIISTGNGMITATLEGRTLTVTGSFSNLIGQFDATIEGGAHIHQGVVGRNGPISLLLTTRTSSNLKAGYFDASANTFELTNEQLAILTNREFYVNIHSTVFPGGELRAQLLPRADYFFQSNLLGINEVPANNSSATGNAIFELTGNQLVVSGSFDGFDSTVATDLAGGGHIHAGFAGQNGPIDIILNITLDDDIQGGVFEAANNTFTLTNGQLDTLGRQQLYVNVHSEANRMGEVRGQIVPLSTAYFVADLSGAQEVPPISASSDGRVIVTYNANSTITVSGSFNNLEGDLNTALAGGAHLHLAPAGENGDIIFPLVVQTSDYRNGVFLPEQNTFTLSSSQRTALFTEGIYVNIHSLVNVPGEIRGQLVGLTIPECGNPTLAAPEVCTAPSNPTVTPIAATRLLIEWPAIDNAVAYIFQVRLVGGDWAVTVRLSQAQAKIWAVQNSNFEYRIQTICQDGSRSEFSSIYQFSTKDFDGSTLAESRTAFKADIVLNSLEDLSKDWSIGPNPVVDRLQLNYLTTNEEVQLSIYHISGKKMFDQKLANNSATHSINTSALESGVYFLIINEKDGKMLSERIIKENR